MRRFGSESKSYFLPSPKSPGRSHLQFEPNMLHRHSQSRQHKLRLGLQVLPRMMQRRPRLQQKIDTKHYYTLLHSHLEIV